ncbi:mannosyl-oligosaccharide alpha-1,2-mannosidase IA isoform X4 [Polistes fuscatus]|uniref:mannosyl-oligosaccharide alpha-1,2-mannosidase IA isoform X4 n=1 Tax=Polistes fuscatus TaxID=30207 RepID=UPI001CA92971|nr:mannosyl-oligosaccharide alpha-1,2-mannosidase IA isoform X4 [Polistes fuscatus]
MQKAGPDLLMPAPPRFSLGDSFNDESYSSHHPNALPMPLGHEAAYNVDVHLIEDRMKLLAKINEEYQQQKTLEKPEIVGSDSRVRTSSLSSSVIVQQRNEQVFETVPPAPAVKLPLIVGGEDKDEIARERRNKVKENSEISLFETNIRFMGSLLACYALTGDVMFRDKAAQLGERMLPAFQTDTGIPHSLINLHTGASKNYGWASSGCSILSEIGTMHLEFTYLSDITGNPIFKTKVENVRKVLKNLEKPKGLYPNYIHPRTGKWGQHHMSLGGLGDSFYEYLLKAWIQSGKADTEAREMYDEAIAAISEHMIKTSPGKLLYVSDLKYDRPEHKMGHLACFAGGMFALGAKTLENDVSDKYMGIAAGLTNTCHESYDRSVTKLGPEAFHFIEGNEARSLKTGEKYYILRPETFESYFVMWRLTKDPKYREWGWEAVQALEKHCRVPGGFTGLHNVYLANSPKDDVQQSYFFAETLKYLYLLFSDDDLINLNDWVFNSEAHVLPIRGNPLYRPSPPL